jgi:hypothetical protein
MKLGALSEIIADLVASGARQDHEVFLHLALGDSDRQRIIDSCNWSVDAIHVADSDEFVVIAGAPEPT